MSDTRTIAERIADCTIAKASDSTWQGERFMRAEIERMGVDDERRHAAMRDTYGRVVYGLMVTQGVVDPWDWEDAEAWRRTLCCDIAEAVIAAYVAGEIVPTDGGTEGDGLS